MAWMPSVKVFRPNRLKRSRRRFQPFGESANTQKMNHKMHLARLRLQGTNQSFGVTVALLSPYLIMTRCQSKPM